MTMPDQAAIKTCAQANIRLYEDDRQEKVDILPLKANLPSKPVRRTAFDANPSFAKARRARKPVVAFQSKTGNSILIVPTKAYASIYDFACRASPSEWRAFWQFVYAVRSQLQGKFGGHFYISTLGVDVPQLHVRLERRPNMTYYLDLSAVSAPDQALILSYANEPGGWAGRFQCRISKGTKTKRDACIYFAPPQYLEDQFGAEFRDLSVTHMGVTPTPDFKPCVYFNLRNWNRVPPQFRGTLTTYRKYLVQHELGHALFHITVHDKEPTSGACPVMMQQTRGTHTCEPGIESHPHNWVPEKSSRLDSWLYNL